jgi:transcription elongation factor GreA
MADPRHFAPAVEPVHVDVGGGREPRLLLTQAEFEALVRELEELRSSHRTELEGRLREARAFGGSTENDDLLAVLEECAVERARIAQLEELVRMASVADGAAADAGAGLGSTVRVADERDRRTHYELIGRRSQDSKRHEVTLGSPVGQALHGARPGDVVHVALPNGRDRTLRVLDVQGSTSAEDVVRAA